MSGVLVHWIASTHCGTDRLLVEESAPPAYQNPHDLTFFCVAYNNCGWAPADRCFFTEPGSAHGEIAFAHDPQQEEERQHDACLDKLELPMNVAKTHTYVDVLWQDGTQQHGVPSESMVPLHIINDQDFLPGHHVVDSAFLDGGATASTINDDITLDGSTKPARRVGVVRTVCCRDQTVNVSWFKATACPSEDREVECNETVSAYDLELHPDDLPNLGDIVVRLLPSRSSDRGTSVQSWSNTKKNADLSWVGRVIDLPDGHVQVKWGDSSISTVRVYAYSCGYHEKI
jgi:ubiquitin-conjugating enzyme E2 O